MVRATIKISDGGAVRGHRAGGDALRRGRRDVLPPPLRPREQQQRQRRVAAGLQAATTTRSARRSSGSATILKAIRDVTRSLRGRRANQ